MDKTDAQDPEVQIAEDPNAPTGLLLADLGWIWRKYKVAFVGFFLGWLFVGFIVALTVLLANLGS